MATRKRGDCVAKVMEADRRQPGTTQQRLELKDLDVAAPEWLAGGVGEDQVVARVGDRQDDAADVWRLLRAGLPGLPRYRIAANLRLD